MPKRTPRLPPLKAIRVFEAAARHLSFTRAADELAVTQAAVSHQIKALEEHLGQPLFRRLNRALALTPAGAEFYPTIRNAIEAIATAIERLRDPLQSGVLNVSLLTTFLTRWLVPRLPAWPAAHPKIELRMTTAHRLVDFRRDDIDVAVRYGLGRWPGVHAARMFTPRLIPVCSPALAEGLREPADLMGQTLLIDTAAPDEWEMWFTGIGQRALKPRRWIGFDSTAAALQAAAEGVGIAIGLDPFVESDLAAGRLLAPFDVRVPTQSAFYVVCGDDNRERPKIKAFREWLLAEVKRSERGGRAAAAPQVASSGRSR